jgi:hypothetical protein
VTAINIALGEYPCPLSMIHLGVFKNKHALGELMWIDWPAYDAFMANCGRGTMEKFRGEVYKSFF